MQVEAWRDEVRQALEVWGQWLRSLPGPAVGYVVTTYSERLDRETVTVAENATAEAMDRVLAQVKSSSLDAYRVLHRYYYLGESIREIAEAMRVSRARVSELMTVGEAMAGSLWGVRYGRSAPAA